MDVAVSFALEKRLEWLRRSHDPEEMKIYGQPSRLMARYLLTNGSTFYMDEHFCGLVDHARVTVPDDLKFETEWMLDKQGFLWLEKPFSVPEIKPQTVQGRRHGQFVEMEPKDLKGFGLSAIAWCVLDGEALRIANEKCREAGRPDIPKGATQFMTFMDTGVLHGKNMDDFGIWSFFVLRPGEKVLERTRLFEELVSNSRYKKPIVGEGMYIKDGNTKEKIDKLHELRWVYTAMYMMAQKLAVTKELTAERGVRRRWQREGSPLQPTLRVVTLRRLEEHRKEHPHQSVEWSCQWLVHGFWRNQWFPSTEEHKQTWVDSYVKGPDDKPFRAAAATVYKAAR